MSIDLKPVDLKQGKWLNEPKTWTIENNELTVTTDKARDFWRETFYGFVRDSGHFYGFSTGNNFTAQLRVKGQFHELYDQAGLMVRIDESHWIKVGVEFTDGERYFSSVLTNPTSDWNVAQPFDNLEDFYIRVTVSKGSIRVQSSSDAKLWHLARLAPFPQADNYLVGPMTCTPEREGLTSTFSEFELGPAMTKDLHDRT
ncbi:Ree1p [Sugiyamaella lignohabitans]|uniref:Ree1p n=1 Tax=Sugiyamaella lignohabitans TaxID=796027 RepID=A0A167F969_9ASCO|nr:Ree1p [Sugiyamaella lignohabitans]ANB14984.1 Ree1p [Sugiyamaella lignohabitans]